MAEKKGKRLSPQDLRALVNVLRLWPTEYRDRVAPLYHHMVYLTGKIESLETELRQVKQLSMELMPQPASPTPYTGVPKCEWEGEGLRRRLARMIQTNLQGSREWELTLKWNRLTEDQALELSRQETKACT